MIFILFFCLIVLGIPVAISLGISGIFIIITHHLGIGMLSPNFYSDIAKFPLLAIPFFVLAGKIMEKVGMAEKIVGIAALLGRYINRSLSIIAVIAGMFWAAVSGSGPADTATLTSIFVPGMEKSGYPKPFSAALVAASGSLGIIIPPSIALIIYGDITDTSVAALFAAGIIPGIVVGLFLMITSYWVSKRFKIAERIQKDRTVKNSHKGALWAIVTPLIIMGGIYAGIFTPTESAVVAVVYGLFVGTFIYKSLTWKLLYDILVESLLNSSMIMAIVAFAGIMSWAASTVGTMSVITHFFISSVHSNLEMIAMINVLLLFAGMFLDAISIFYIFLPIFIPIMGQFGFNPIWFGMLMVVNLAIGQITPPMGINLFVASRMANVSVEDISKYELFFIAAAVLALILLVFVPEMALIIPKLFHLSA